MDAELDVMSLTVRARMALQEALSGRSFTRDNMRALTQSDLRRLPGVGPVTLKEIVGWAKQHGIELQQR
jgi:hypothetical protein